MVLHLFFSPPNSIFIAGGAVLCLWWLPWIVSSSDEIGIYFGGNGNFFWLASVYLEVSSSTLLLWFSSCWYYSNSKYYSVINSILFNKIGRLYSLSSIVKRACYEHLICDTETLNTFTGIGWLQNQLGQGKLNYHFHHTTAELLWQKSKHSSLM